MITKACSTCKEVLPASDFYPHKRMRLGLQSNCKKCSRQWHRDRPEYVKRKNEEWKKANPEYMLNWQRESRTGATAEEVASIREKQSGLCAGCGIDLSLAKECLDHCHKTGKVRGLLCDDCNIALGRAKDSASTLRNLAAYLEAEDY